MMEMCNFRESDGAWHGSCLALAELGRRGLLLPARLGEVVPVVLRALAYDEMRGACSVGAHVRDAACYVAWAFARAYEPAVIKPFIGDIASALLVVTTFDREINVRRAASAAFQENVGRQGTLPHGIDIVTTADFFAVGNRTNAYLEISYYIAQFSEYTFALVDHICDVKLAHWDRVIRELAAKALCKLSGRCPEYVRDALRNKVYKNALSIDLNEKHGNVLAFGETLSALSELPACREDGSFEKWLGPDLVEKANTLIPELKKRNAFRGMGGEMIRCAVCTAIAKMADAALPFGSPATVEEWQGTLDDNIVYEETRIQDEASAAFRALAQMHYAALTGDEMEGRCGVVVRRYLGILADKPTPRQLRGICCALGELPKAVTTVYYKEIFAALVEASKLPEAKSEPMTEARRVALEALTRTCMMAVTVGGSGYADVFEALFDGTNDYTIESRGDIGSKVREQSMTCLEQMAMWLLKHDAGLAEGEAALFSAETCTRILCVLIQQSMEKIDRTRSHAGCIMMRLLHHAAPEISVMQNRGELLGIFGDAVRQIDWLAPSVTFPLVIQTLSIPAYRLAALSGLVVSVGGLTESLVRHSSSCIIEWVEEAEEEQLQALATDICAIIESNFHNERMVIPMFKTLDLLLSNGCLEPLLGEDEPFAEQLVVLCKKEMAKCSDVKKLSAAVDVYIGLLAAESTSTDPSGEPTPTRKRVLSQLLIWLCHKYPRVRKLTAEKLYTGLMAVDDIIPEESESNVSDILTNTLWDGNITAARGQRNLICDMAGVARPKTKAKVNVQDATRPQADDLDSYRDLVDRTGY